MLEFPIYRKELSLTFLRTDKSEITLPCEAMLEGDMSLCLIAGNLSSLNVKLYIERIRSRSITENIVICRAFRGYAVTGFENESPFNVAQGGQPEAGII